MNIHERKAEALSLAAKAGLADAAAYGFDGEVVLCVTLAPSAQRVRLAHLLDGRFEVTSTTVTGAAPGGRRSVEYSLKPLGEDRKVRVCPYCGSEHYEWMGAEYEPNEYHCRACDRWFSEEDFKREALRHMISAVLSGAYADSEDRAHTCSAVVGEDEAQGLSSLELPHTEMLYQLNDGTIWVRLGGEWRNLDEFSVRDMENIAEAMGVL